MKKIKVVLSLALILLVLLSSVPFNVGAAEREGDWSYDILDDGTAEVTRYYGMDAVVTIPSEINGIKVTSIYNNCFDNYHVTDIIIPDSVKNIGFAALSGCSNLKTLTIGKGVETIHYASGIGYSGYLSAIVVDEENMYFSSDEYGALYNKDKTVIIEYPKGNKRKNFNIPGTVKTIGSTAFQSAKNLESIHIPFGVEIIERYAFHSTDFKEILIPDSVIVIGDRAFANCEIEELTIPDSVVEIGERAFWQDRKLVNVYIGKNVNSISEGAFSENISMESVFVAPENKFFSNDENGALFNKDKTKLIQYPIGNRESIYIIPDGVQTIGKEAFSFPTHSSTCYLTYITIPDSVKIIEEGAFYFYEVYSTGEYIKSVYFKGSREQWNGIVVEKDNEYLAKATIHFDSNGDSICDDCGESYNKGLNCSHICHKENVFYKKFLYPMLNFFWKLFKINKYCKCGMEHYN